MENKSRTPFNLDTDLARKVLAKYLEDPTKTRRQIADELGWDSCSHISRILCAAGYRKNAIYAPKKHYAREEKPRGNIENGIEKTFFCSMCDDTYSQVVSPHERYDMKIPHIFCANHKALIANSSQLIDGLDALDMTGYAGRQTPARGGGL